jgi:hypothetical protein
MTIIVFWVLRVLKGMRIMVKIRVWRSWLSLRVSVHWVNFKLLSFVLNLRIVRTRMAAWSKLGLELRVLIGNIWIEGQLVELSIKLLRKSAWNEFLPNGSLGQFLSQRAVSLAIWKTFLDFRAITQFNAFSLLDIKVWFLIHETWYELVP